MSYVCVCAVTTGVGRVDCLLFLFYDSISVRILCSLIDSKCKRRKDRAVRNTNVQSARKGGREGREMNKYQKRRKKDTKKRVLDRKTTIASYTL